MKLNGVSFKWKKDHKNTYPHYGLIAQETEKVFPSLIDHTGKTKKTKHIEYNGFAGIMIEAIKERQKILDILKSEVEKDQANIDLLYKNHKAINDNNELLEKKLNKLIKKKYELKRAPSNSLGYTGVKIF